MTYVSKEGTVRSLHLDVDANIIEEDEPGESDVQPSQALVRAATTLGFHGAHPQPVHNHRALFGKVT